jgi:FKBP12-rapamycin complex-associated protein
MGVLEYMQKNFDHFELSEDWCLKLNKWEGAKSVFQKREELNPYEPEVIKNTLNCYKAMSNWSDLSQTVEKLWKKIEEGQMGDDFPKTGNLIDTKQKKLEEVRTSIANIACYSAWNLHNWDNFEEYLNFVDEDEHNYEKNFYKAILNIKKNNYSEAQNFIDRAREIIDPKLTSLIGESYNRAYSLVIELQYLKELEEVIEYKKSENEEKKEHLYGLWKERFNHI